MLAQTGLAESSLRILEIKSMCTGIMISEVWVDLS